MNAIINNPNPSNNPQAFESDQGTSVPPHSRPRNKQTILEMKRIVPPRSILTIFSLNVRFNFSLFGSRNENIIMKIDNAPKAIKHQLSSSKAKKTTHAN